MSDASSAAQHIDREAFRRRFAGAVDAAVTFAADMVIQRLPASHRFVIEPNASYDGNPLVDDERLYPEDSLPTGQILGPMTFEEALNWMWRDGQVPEWVDVSVCEIDANHTYVRLICCGRFTGREDRLYYRDDRPPFGIKSPTLPRDWKSVEESGRFDLLHDGRRPRIRSRAT